MLPLISDSGIRRTRRLSWAPSGWLVTGTTIGTDTDFVTLTCPDDFVAIRVGFANINPASYSITKVVAAASSTLGDCANPSDGAVWRTLTFLNKGTARDVVVAGCEAPTEITVYGNLPDPAAGHIGGPRWTWTDWNPLTSMPRTDLPGAPRIAMIRVLLPSGCRHTRPNGGFHEYHRRPEINRGFAYVAGHVPADMVTLPSHIQAYSACMGHTNVPVSCVQFLTKKPGVIGMVAGDSHHQGTSTTTQFWNYLLQSTVELGVRHLGDIPFGYWSTAQGGADSQSFFNALANVLPVAQPSFVVLPGWTYNDLSDSVHADRLADDIFFARLLMAAETCVHQGATPIFLTPFPRDLGGMTSVQVQPWRGLRASILTLRQIGAIVIDATQLLGHTLNGQFDGTYLSQYSNDHAHPNDLGHAAIANELTPIIERLCGLSSSTNL